MHTKMKLGAAALATAVVAALAGRLLLDLSSRNPGERVAAAPAEASAAPVAEPLPARPSQALAQLVEATAQGQSTPFLADVAGRIPPGQVAVAQADQVDAGAEEGHTVPVTVWVDGGEQVAGLQGTARFLRVRGGWQVHELSLTLLPLKVSTWSDAATAARRLSAGARRGESPFYGRFRFTDGASRVAVDALTGLAEAE